MKLTPWLLTLVAFAVICLMAVTFFFKKLWATEVVQTPPIPARTMPMAITEIEPGTVITMKHIGNGPIGADTKLAPDTIRSLDSLVGRIARERIPSAVPLQGSMFYAVGDYPSLQIQDGMRAVPITIDDATAVLSGMIKPGQFVDVHMTTDAGGSSGSAVRLQSTGGSMALGSGVGANRSGMTVTLFKGVKVVAVSRAGGATSSLQGGGTSQSVTLELDEDQARRMLLAQRNGSIALTYNPVGSGTNGIEIKSEENRVTVEQLLGLSKEPEPKKPFKTEHYHGGGRSTSYWNDGERIDYQGSGDGNGGSRLQSTGGSVGGWQTDAAPSTNNDLTQKQQQPALSGAL